MSAYSRPPRNTPSPSPQNQPQKTGENQEIRIDGRGQILAMLEAADPAFRESLLKRLAARDFDLAKELRSSLKQPRYR